MRQKPAKRPAKNAGKPVVRRRRQQRSADTQQKILDAAAEEFALHGFIGTSTRLVAARAGVQHPALTYHFGNKDGLWRALMRGLNESVLSTMKARLQALRGVDKITTLRLMDHEAGNGGERMSWLVDEFVKEFFDLLVPLIESAQKDGGFVAGDAHHLVYLFIGAATRLFMLAPEVKKISGRSPMTVGYIQEHTDLCLSLFFHESAAPARRYRQP